MPVPIFPPAPAGLTGWVCLSVEDTGLGIADDLKEKIFDPFFSTKEHGNGLGLAVVQQIVESCGGHIAVRSRPGKGSRFDVWLPRDLSPLPQILGSAVNEHGSETGSKENSNSNLAIL